MNEHRDPSTFLLSPGVDPNSTPYEGREAL